ncbi:phosphoglycerate kinase, partial [candidate division WWE3 bacterium CG_4_10_14_0_2_um_filter_42_7]
MKIVSEAEVKGKKVLVRCDFDVPLKNGTVADEERIERSLKTIKCLVKKEAKVILLSHLGRPEGKVVAGLRLDPVAKSLSKKLDGAVIKLDECLGNSVKETVAEMEKGDIVLLENLRFYKEEEKNDPEFAKKLSALGDIYVNEAIAVSHRSHASITGIPKYLPSYAGFNFAEEVKNFLKILENPRRPLVFLMGGAKPETKAPLVSKFAKIANFVLVGGALMNDQNLKTQGNIIFPVDNIDKLDIGPKTITLFENYLKEAGTIVWNGPLSKYEEPKYVTGTKEIAKFFGKINAFKVVGGGDTITSVKRFGKLTDFDFVSSAGG